MAHLEIQIANSSLNKALEQALTPRLYAQCFIIPDDVLVKGLVLEKLAFGGFLSPTPKDPNPGSVTIPVRVYISLTTADDVKSANGGPPATWPPILITAYSVLTSSGTVLTASFGGIKHDPEYDNLKPFVGAGNLATWEAQLQTALDSEPLFQHDFASDLPPELSTLTFARSEVSADSVRLAIRFEIGDSLSDGDWSDFEAGKLDDRLQGNEWGMFVSSDGVLQVAKATLLQAVSGAGGTLGKSAWAPQGSTAAVNAEAFVVLSIPIIGDITVGITAVITFTMAVKGIMRTDISYNVQVEGDVGADILNDLDLGNTFAAGSSNVTLPPGYIKVADREFYKNTTISTLVLKDPLTAAKVLLMAASTIIGLPEGMLIAGTATVPVGLGAPDCNVSENPFILQYLTSCSDIRDHKQPPRTAPNVTGVASFTVSESGTGQLPLIIGALQWVSDPAVQPDPEPVFPQFTPYLPAIDQFDAGSGATFQVTVTSINSGYENNPYLCQFLVLTNGGARYVSLGKIPIPIIDQFRPREQCENDLYP